MKQILTPERDTVIFDCDGVFYSWNIYGGMEQAKVFCADVKADVVPHLFPFMTREEAAVLGKRSFEDTGDGLRYFVAMARERGYDEEEFREQLHIAYHQLQLQRVREQYPQVLAPCLESIQHLDALKGAGVQFGVISQSCKENWLNHVLGEKGVLNHFNPAHLFGFKEFGWNEKSLSARGLGIVMEVMEVEPRRVIFVEDTKKNLYPVKVAYEEVLTAHLNDWQTTDPEDDYIDLSAESNLHFLRQYRAVHAPQPRLQSAANTLGLHL